ncbi:MULTISPECIES: DUF11 domain-containing protein [Kitasatospora]|uniref:DUF11 domain-containing protein n=1 Tax=Kitasatospora setae (strain ATCC 33774 / DSM 43861 / JCM 3304 / KCC A-0304 / NBRC 14216 / KM-6054) TaxID=452652 RepID=E4NFU3_KITSK|nr:DUF11 domain-containing protein [Kitasatospora setae]BAJ30373.1 hypothetical protein KSE_45920 [Kitasatospora setae KM-6054]
MAVALGLALSALGTAPVAAADRTGHGGRAAQGHPAAGAVRVAGVPAAPIPVYAEDFENVPAGSGPVRITSYTGTSGETYTADPVWLAYCNGWVMDDVDRGTVPTECGAPINWDTLANVTRAMGQYSGEDDTAAGLNHGVAAWSEDGSYTANDVQFRTVQQIPLVNSNRFLTGSGTSGAVCYDGAYADPLTNFYLTDGTTEYPVSATPINPCTNPRAQRFTYPTGKQYPIGVVHGAADKPILYSGSTVGVIMRNAAATGAGNDAAFDDIEILDVTPTATKAFSPAAVVVGGTSTLTITVTNTTDLLEKDGWSFTDDLPAGLVVANPANTSTTCTNGAVTATAGGSTVGLSGDLVKGQAMCTLSVDVTSSTAGTYHNCPDANSNLIGMNWTECADVVFAVPQYTITKTATPASGSSVKPGDQVSYRVVVQNTGAVAVDATAADDLTAVLDDAAYDNDAAATAGTVSYAAPTLSWAGTLQPGESATITYTVTVNTPDTGDGQLDNHVTGSSASNCPTGTEPGCTTHENVNSLQITKTSDTATAKPGQKVTYTVTVTNPNGHAYSGATVADDLSAVLDDATYDGDASATSGTVSYAAPVLSWSGDVPAGGSVTLTYSVTVNNPDAGDGKLANTVTGPADSNCPPGAPDGSCSASVPIAELHLGKTSDAKNPVKAGDKVTYTVTISNPGQADYTGAVVTDDLSSALDDAAYGGDAQASSGTVSYAAPVLSWSGDVPAGGSVTVTYSVTVNNPDTGDKQLANAVVGPPDSNCPPGSADAACSTSDGVAELVIAKSSDAKNPVKAGDKVTYTVTIGNPGKAAYTGAVVTDDLSGDLDDAVYGGDAQASSGTVSYAAPVVSWSGDVPAGGSVTVTYSVTVNNPDTGDFELKNAVVGPSGSNCAAGSADPRCSTDDKVAALVIAKSSDAKNPVKAGDKVTYTVTIGNPGKAAYTGAVVTDDLTGDLDDATYGNDASATSGTVSYAAPVVSWNGDVPTGGSVTVTYSVTVNNPDTGDYQLANTVVGPDASNCAKGTRDPRCSTRDRIAALRISKTSDSRRAPVRPGAKVTYTVTVTNPGTAPYPAAQLSDDLSRDLDDAVYDNDAVVVSSTGGDPGVATYAAPVLSWTGGVAPGETVTLTYSVRVNRPDTGDKELANTVVGPDGSNCQAGSTDPACSTNDDVASLVIDKTSDAKNPVKAGDKVTYTVTVTNEGTADYPNAVLVDSLTGDLDDAVYDGDAQASSGTVSYAAPLLSWHGDVAAGQTVTITYSITVGNPDQGDHRLVNAVSGPIGSNCPPLRSAPQCSTENGVAELAITKTSDAEHPVKAGDKVTYTVTIGNDGAAAYPGAVVTDDLSGDLDDAAYGGDAQASSGTVSYAAPVLSWSGDVPAGGSVTVTYSVTVNSPDGGDHELKNAVVGPDGSNCPAGSTDPRCSTADEVAQLAIVKRASTDRVDPGGTVSYTVTVTNTGTAAYPGAAFQDDLGGLLDDAAYDGDARASSGTVSYAAPVLSWTGDLAPGAQAVVTYSVTVDDPDNGDHALDNAVVGPAASNCPAGGKDTDCATHGEVTPANPAPGPHPGPAPLPDTGTGGLVWYAGMAAALAVATGTLLTAGTLRRRSRRS